jgi:hypothetical protein
MKVYTLNKENHKYDVQITHIDRKIYLFYHIYCGSNDWEGIVHEQVLFMRNSKLLINTSKIYISVANVHNGDLQKVQNFFNDTNYEIFYNSDNGACYEFPCMQKMKQLAASEEFYALYLHTKGSSYSRHNFDGPRQQFDWKLIQCVRWRNLMNYYNIYKWNIALSVLQQGYDAYGILYRKYPKEHFSGNFWWATSECIANTQSLSQEFMQDRYNAEFLILNDINGTPTKNIYSPFYRGLLGFIQKKDCEYRLLPYWHYRNILYLFASYTLAH